jgi:cell division protein ZapA
MSNTKSLFQQNKLNRRPPDEMKDQAESPAQWLKQQRTHELTIAGLPFKLRSSHDEKTVKELVEFVDSKMKQAMQATKSGSFQSAAVLAALNIAEELILLKRRAQHELDILEEKALRISQDLENSKMMKGPSGNA